LENSYQKFARDVLIVGIANALVALTGIIFMPLITKTLGAYDYGIWAQVQVTISLVVGFVGLGLPYAMTRFLPVKTDRGEIREEFSSVLSLVFLVTLAVSILLIAGADFVAGAFFDGASTIVRITGLIILVWSLDNVFLSLFRAFRRMRTYAVFTVANQYAQVGLIAYLVLNGHGILSIVLAVLATKAVTTIVLFYLAKSQVGVKRPHFSRIREYLSFGLPTIPGNISSWVVASSDRYVIGYFLGAASVGIYSAGYGLGSLIMMPATVLGLVLPPALSKLYDEGRVDEVKTHLSYSLKYLLALVIPFVFGAFVLAEPVLRLFSTPEIASQGYLVLPIVALSSLFYVAGSVPTQILFLVRKTRIVGIAWIAAALTNLVLNILIVPHFGILGAAITTLIAYLLALGIRAYYAFKEFKFDIQWRPIIKSVAASVIMSAALWAIGPQGTSATILTVVAGAVIYAGVLFLLKGFTKEELRFFKGLFRTGR
jgi:O-antigen/teichoic acid export membrane protein